MEWKNTSYQDILSIEFKNRKARNPRYSLRSFANHLNIGSGALSEILSGKRNLSVAKALAFAEILDFNNEEKKEFINLVGSSKVKAKNGAAKNSESKAKAKLTIAEFEVISSPLCTSILALADLKEFKIDANWISKKLGYTKSEVTEALAKMKSIGLITGTGREKKISTDYIFSPDNISSNAIKNYHHQMLGKAQLALDEQKVASRDISGLSFAINAEDMDKIKKDIIKFQNSIIKKYQSKNPTNVYHLEVALFELTVEDNHEN